MADIYNHFDPLEKQIPLSIKQRDLPRKDLSIRNGIEKRIGIPTAGGKRIVLLLRTDSTHLARFFVENWPTDTSSTRPDATITALKRSAVRYGLEKEFDESRWFDPKTNQVWMFGNEFYGNIKITIRGLCSEISSFEQMFLHGCSLVVDGRGVVLSGVSGAGKTTLTTALRQHKCVVLHTLVSLYLPIPCMILPRWLTISQTIETLTMARRISNRSS